MSRVKLLAALALAASIAVAGCKPRESDVPGFSVPQSPLLAAFERKVGLIAYVGIDGNVYTVDQGGQNPTQLTDDAKLEQNDFHYYEFPTWSPDGQSLAFYGIAGTSQADMKAALYTTDTEGKTLIETFSSDRHMPIYLSWSPDSTKVSFIATIVGGSGLVLNMVPAAGGEAQVLDVGNPYYWDWLPDSSGVVVHTGGAQSQNGEARLALLTLGDGVVEDTLALKPSLFQSPALSPDGSQLLLAVEDDGGKNTLVLTDRLGSVQSAVATLNNSVAFAWSPDGKRVAYIESDGSSQLTLGKLIFVALGDEPKTVAADQEGVVAFFWAPDSKQVAYFVPVQVTATPEPGSDTAAEDTALFFKMYVTDADSGVSKLIASFVPTQDYLRTIPYFEQYSRSTTIWSPDSQNLVVSAYAPDGTPGVFIVPASGVTQPRFLQPGTVAFWSGK